MSKVLAAIILVCLVIGFGLLIMNKNSSVPLDQQLQQSGIKNYTFTEVVSHNSDSSCWASINGKVYDLTNWIPGHPGGPDKILSLCGKDASQLFNTQHNGQAFPLNVLSTFYIGDLNP